MTPESPAVCRAITDFESELQYWIYSRVTALTAFKQQVKNVANPFINTTDAINCLHFNKILLITLNLDVTSLIAQALFVRPAQI